MNHMSHISEAGFRAPKFELNSLNRSKNTLEKF